MTGACIKIDRFFSEVVSGFFFFFFFLTKDLSTKNASRSFYSPTPEETYRPTVDWSDLVKEKRKGRARFWSWNWKGGSARRPRSCDRTRGNKEKRKARQRAKGEEGAWPKGERKDRDQSWERRTSGGTKLWATPKVFSLSDPAHLVERANGKSRAHDRTWSWEDRALSLRWLMTSTTTGDGRWATGDGRRAATITNRVQCTHLDERRRTNRRRTNERTNELSSHRVRDQESSPAREVVGWRFSRWLHPGFGGKGCEAERRRRDGGWKIGERKRKLMLTREERGQGTDTEDGDRERGKESRTKTSV